MKSLLLRPIVSELCGCTYLWIDIAASLPAAIASIANLGPVYTSPPINTSGSVVWYVSLSALTLTPSISTFVPFNKSPQIVVWPILKNTWLHLTVLVSFSSYWGLNLPSASLTDVHLLRTIPVTFPFSVRISLGPQPQSSLTPSSTASSISSSEAGILALSSRQNIDTL